MKKIITLALAFICVAVLIICFSNIKNNNNSLDFSFDENGYYTGFSNLPINYTIEAAKNGEYFTTQNLEVIANKNMWDNFVEASLRSENASIRLVKFYAESADSPYFLDLFYKDGNFYLFDSTAESQKKQPYLYLLTLEGQFGNPLKNSGVIVLTNDNSLTFDTVMKVLVSSNMDYIKSISPFRIVTFK